MRSYRKFSLTMALSKKIGFREAFFRHAVQPETKLFRKISINNRSRFLRYVVKIVQNKITHETRTLSIK